MNVVAIGGGHGLAQVLRAVRRLRVRASDSEPGGGDLQVRPTAVVTAADDGGSSGRLRRELGVIALGDLRMALLALAREQQLADVLAHRFPRGDLAGHALGNLLLLALSERADGDVLGALRAAELLLRCEGSVLPSTTVPVQLSARIAGRRVDGQAKVTSSHGRVDDLWLEPRDPPACREAVQAVRDADVVILGPGSLFTSIVANLLVPELRHAVRDSDARLVHVANVQASPEESADMSLADHVRLLHDMLDGRTLDVVIAHDGPPPAGRGAALRAASPLAGADHVVAADLLDRRQDGSVGRAHDPVRLAAALTTALASKPVATQRVRAREDLQRARASASEPGGGDLQRARASASEPGGGDRQGARVR